MKPSLHLRGDRIGRDVDAADVDRAARRLQDAGDHAQRRRLAGAVRAEKAEQLARRHLEIDRRRRR